MDTSGTLSDDDYDVISNPGDFSLDSGAALLQSRNLVTWEPRPCPSSEKFEAAQWTATDIQDYVRRVAGDRCAGFENKAVHIYVDGFFDPLSVSHVLLLRQAKLSFPEVHLVVGVFSDQTIREHNCEPSWPEAERYELARHCRWVDEVIPEAPWELNEDFLRSNGIDLVAIEEGASVNPAYDKIRVRGYDEVKRLGRAIPMRRITGVQSAIRRASPVFSSATASPSTPTPPSPPGVFCGH